MTGSLELPAGWKCGAGMFLSLGDCGRDGAPITYKAWACSSPDRGFKVRIDKGDRAFGRLVVHAQK